MSVDVQVETKIALQRDDVAAFACDPRNAPRWYVNIKSAEWKTSPPLAVGSQMAFVAQFLGRRLSYTYEVVEYVKGRKLVMRTIDGPFRMQTSYTWNDDGPGACLMRLRNQGEPNGFSRFAAPLMSLAMRRAMGKDLLRLKGILEGTAPRS